jgi:hypothetical protein
MSKELEHNVKGLDKTKRSNDESDKRAKNRFDCDDRDDDVPVYLLNADGTVQQVMPDGQLKAISKNGTDGINGILEPDGTAWRPRNGEPNPYPIKDGGPGAERVASRRLGPGEKTDLASATQLARYAKGDYGGGNYAAANYTDEKGNRMILVGNSKGPHSERTIGYPLLRHGE